MKLTSGGVGVRKVLVGVIRPMRACKVVPCLCCQHFLELRLLLLRQGLGEDDAEFDDHVAKGPRGLADGHALATVHTRGERGRGGLQKSLGLQAGSALALDQCVCSSVTGKTAIRVPLSHVDPKKVLLTCFHHESEVTPGVGVWLQHVCFCDYERFSFEVLHYLGAVTVARSKHAQTLATSWSINPGRHRHGAHATPTHALKLRTGVRGVRGVHNDAYCLQGGCLDSESSLTQLSRPRIA